MQKVPITLGDKLAPTFQEKNLIGFGARLVKIAHITLGLSLLMALSAFPLWWYFTHSDIAGVNIILLTFGLGGIWLFIDRQFRMRLHGNETSPSKTHSLLANDRQGFMKDLRLDTKTVIFDGSNIYHFGHDNGLDAQPLGMIAHQLRTEGYRIVCFFDASIFHTLHDHGAFSNNQRHSPKMLEDIFGLQADEIYVVPSGEQADKYVLNSLKYLPISFTVSNDKFRDYTKRYPTVMKGNQWRKGVVISKNEIKLLQHRFRNPVRLT